MKTNARGSSSRTGSAVLEHGTAAPRLRSDATAWLGAVLLLALTVTAYAPALRAGYVWDDDDYVKDNPALRTAGGLIDIWFRPGQTPQYYPMVHTLYWVEYHVWGEWWAGYHLVNILLHAASAVLLWRLLGRLEVPGAWLIAGIFAVHPVHVESVAWITERKNTLSLVFYLLSLGAYLRAAGLSCRGDSRVARPLRSPGEGDTGVAPAESAPAMDWRWYGVALGLFVSALLSKTVTCSLPAAVLLLIWWKRGRIELRRDVVPLVPFFVLGLALAAVTGYLERSQVGAAGREWDLKWAQRVLIAGQAFWFYVGKLLWPTRLSFIYPRWDMRTDGLFTINPAGWQWVYPAAAVVLVVGLFLLRKRLGRGPVVAVLFFAGTLVPALGFINIFPMRYSFVADHFQYHASIGMLALVGAGVALAARRLAAARAAVVWGVVLLPLVVLTFVQARVYRDWETLFTDAREKNPNSWMIWTNLGHAARVARDMPKARADYAKALELAPDVPDTHLNWGLILMIDDRYEEAVRSFDRAIELNEGFARAWYNRGNALRELKRPPEATASYERAVAIDPTYARAWYRLGVEYREAGRAADAERAYRAAVRHAPVAEAHCDLAGLLAQAGRWAEAIDEYERALAIDPTLTPAQVGLRRALILRQGG